MFSGSSLNVPMYVPGAVDSTPAISDFIMELRRAHAIVIGSPAYHGGISGLIKNALDYVQEMSDDGAPYFTGRAIGCIATGHGWQGTNSTLAAIRDIAHALRGWPTSLGIALNSCEPLFNERGECTRPEVENQLQTLAEQLLWSRRGDSRPESSLDREADSC
jgi:FMN reductase